MHPLPPVDCRVKESDRTIPHNFKTARKSEQKRASLSKTVEIPHSAAVRKFFKTVSFFHNCTVRKFCISCASLLLALLTGCNEPCDKRDTDPAPPPAPATTAPNNAALDAAITRASDALWKLQGEDGGWHSPVYGHFKPGAAESPLVLAVLSRLPASERTPHDAAIKKAIAFVIDQQGKEGGLGTKGEWLEVPTYATSLGILALSRLKPDGWQKTIEPWVAYLKSAQNSEENGCKSGETPYGGWGPEGRPVQGIPRRSDISSTRYALQALVAAGVAADDKVWERAEEFLKRTHALSKDGGFTFSPTNPELNKAGHEKDTVNYRSYGSATADGILCLNIIGKLRPEDAPSASTGIKALLWMMESCDVEHCPGLQATELEKIGWKDGLTFYYREALAEMGGPRDMKTGRRMWNELADATIKSELPDGSWANETTIMKEDDPLIATSFALETLLLCREALSKKPGVRLEE